MLKGIDIQMLTFVGISLLQEYLNFVQFPKVYYWSLEQSNNDNDKKKLA